METQTQQVDSLTEMVRNSSPEEKVVSSGELDITESASEETQPEVVETPRSSIDVISLSNWFDSNVDNFPNIKKPKVTIAGVDPMEQLILTILIDVVDGVEKRKVKVFDDAHLIPVLDLPAVDMQIYNNGFRIVYDLGNGVFIKSYGVRTGIVSVFCQDVGDMLIPFDIVRSKKRDDNITISSCDATTIGSSLAMSLDYEAFQIRYKQSSKAEDLTTNLSAIQWLIERQASIFDVNHHIEIDRVIIETLK